MGLLGWLVRWFLATGGSKVFYLVACRFCGSRVRFGHKLSLQRSLNLEVALDFWNLLNVKMRMLNKVLLGCVNCVLCKAKATKVE